MLTWRPLRPKGRVGSGVPAGGVEQTGVAHLQAGLHPIRLYYRHGTGTAKLDFAWSGPNFTRRALKAGDLRIDSASAHAKPN